MQALTTISVPKPNNTIFTFAFERNTTTAGIDKIILAGDIGGTKSNLALFKMNNESLEPLFEKTYATKEYSSFIEILQLFLKNTSQKINSICIGVAGPVTNGKVKATNFS